MGFLCMTLTKQVLFKFEDYFSQPYKLTTLEEKNNQCKRHLFTSKTILLRRLGLRSRKHNLHIIRTEIKCHFCINGAVIICFTSYILLIHIAYISDHHNPLTRAVCLGLISSNFSFWPVYLLWILLAIRKLGESYRSDIYLNSKEHDEANARVMVWYPRFQPGRPGPLYEKSVRFILQLHADILYRKTSGAPWY